MFTLLIKHENVTYFINSLTKVIGNKYWFLLEPNMEQTNFVNFLKIKVFALLLFMETKAKEQEQKLWQTLKRKRFVF